MKVKSEFFDKIKRETDIYEKYKILLRWSIFRKFIMKKILGCDYRKIPNKSSLLRNMYNQFIRSYLLEKIIVIIISISTLISIYNNFNIVKNYINIHNLNNDLIYLICLIIVLLIYLLGSKKMILVILDSINFSNEFFQYNCIKRKLHNYLDPNKKNITKEDYINLVKEYLRCKNTTVDFKFTEVLSFFLIILSTILSFTNQNGDRIIWIMRILIIVIIIEKVINNKKIKQLKILDQYILNDFYFNLCRESIYYLKDQYELTLEEQNEILMLNLVENVLI